MATYAVRPPVVVKTHQGTGDTVAYLPPGSGVTVKKGDLVYRTSGGTLGVCGADPAAILGVALMGNDDRIMANFGELTDDIEVELIYPDSIVEMTLAGTYAETDKGTAYGIAIDTATGYAVIDKTDTTNTRVVVLEPANDMGRKYAPGDTNIRVRARFLNTYLQTTG